MADMYYIDLIQPRTNYIGSDDYLIHSVGGPPKKHVGGHAGRNRYNSSRGIPLFYTVEFGDVPIQNQDDLYIPDNVGGTYPDIIYPAGWGGPAINLSAEFRAVQHRDPTPVECANLEWYRNMGNLAESEAKKGNGPQNRERDYWNYLGFAEYYINHLVLVDDHKTQLGRSKWLPGMQAQWQAIADRGNDIVNKKVAASKGFFSKAASAIGSVAGDAVHTMNSAAAIAGKAVNQAGSAVSHIPIVGKPLKSALALNPVTAAGGLVSKIAHGERLDHAFIDAAKGQIAAAREVAPYVQMVMSVVPGAGTGIASAIAIGTALADGRSITDAVLSSLAAAVPGGTLGKLAFKAATDIAHGSSITEAAMNSALSQLPPAAQTAARTAIAAARGKNVREAVLQAIRNQLPPDARKALEVGTAIGIARNIQSNVAKELSKPAAISKLVAAAKVPPQLVNAVPKTAEGAKGFKAALALASHSGVSATSLATARSALSPAAKEGFDHGLKSYINTVAAPELGSLVRGGVVARGKWRPARSGEQGTPGRLVMNGQVTHGNYIRES